VLDALPEMRIYKHSSKGGRKHGRETITITVPKQHVADAKEIARILGYPGDDLGRVIEEYGWTIPEALRDLRSDMEYRTWNNEQECRQVAARVAERLKADTVVKIGRPGEEWVMRFFQKDHPRIYLWEKCEEHGLDFDECDGNHFHQNSDVRKFVDEKLAAAA